MTANLSQQLNTLLYHLTHHQKPSFEIEFWSSLTEIHFDYSVQSLEKINQLFIELTVQGHTITTLTQTVGGRNFILAIASYLANYIAHNVGGVLVWFDHAQAQQEISKQNQKYNTEFSLQSHFETSLMARINQTVYCQPLQVISNLLQGHSNLLSFMAEMQLTALGKVHIDVHQDPNQVVLEYLALLKSGQLYQTNIGFFQEICHIQFDYSQKSLEQIDQALDKIKQKYQLNTNSYMQIIDDAKNQTFLYLLGFYIGMTSSRLANVAVRWVNYQQMSAMIKDSGFSHCIEHSFVLLMENHYRLPILVLTNRLFGIAPNMPNSVVAFAQQIDKENRGQLNVFLQTDPVAHSQIASLPKNWQTLAKQTGGLLVKQLLTIAKQQSVKPTITVAKIDPNTQKSTIQMQSMSQSDVNGAIDTLYRQLADNPYLLPFQVASFDMYANLPVGRTDGIVFELRTYDEDNLQLQFILPYQKRENGFVFFPLLNNQENMPSQAHSLAQIIYLSALHLLKKAQQDKGVEFWQEHFVATLDLYGITQAQVLAKQQDSVLVENIHIPLLPIEGEKNQYVSTIDDKMFHHEQEVGQRPESTETVTQPIVQNTVDNAYLDKKDEKQTVVKNVNVSQIDWRQINIAQTVAQLPAEQREYLQVLVPDSLVNDELFSQAQALNDLYQQGQVVWGVMIQADNVLCEPDSRVVDGLGYDTNSDFATLDIVYDPTGQTSIEQLQDYANKLINLAVADIQKLPADQIVIAMHLQDKKSRLFGYAFPKSLANTLCQVSSLWVWRPHLPNGMISSPVLPIMVKADNGGRVAVFPARFWQKDYYQDWLNKGKKQLNSSKDFDLMPHIIQQENLGLRYANPKFTPRLFPKYKHQVSTMSQHNMENTQQLSDINVGSLAPVNSKMASLPLELQQQLMRDQQRLQSTLTTTDHKKDKKMMMIVGVLVVLLLLGFILLKILS